MAVAGVPYGFLHRGGGPFRVGDQASVVPSFCGEGVAMALWSGIRAAKAIGAGRGAEAFHAAWARDVGGGMRLAGVLAAGTAAMPGLMAATMSLAPAACGWVARRTRLGLVQGA
jgi:flavin-dependent dehydrogenase